MRTAADCFKILRDIKDTSMATVGKDGTPRVRIIDTTAARATARHRISTACAGAKYVHAVNDKIRKTGR